MILTGPEIIRQHGLGALRIDPFNVDQVNPNSYNFRDMMRIAILGANGQLGMDLQQVGGESFRTFEFIPLTRRELEVLGLLVEGWPNQQIAAALFVTERTVEAHVKQIFQKLSLSTDPGSHRRVLAVLAYMRQPG